MKKAISKKSVSIVLILALLCSLMSYAVADATDGGTSTVTEDVYGEETVTDDVYGEETVTGAVYDESNSWVTTVEGAAWTTVPNGVTLTGKDAIGAYASETFKEEAFEFTFNAELEEGAWPGVALRLKSYDRPIWENNAGYLVVFKSGVIEFQHFGGVDQPGNPIIHDIKNLGIVNSGQDHKVRVSTVDVADGVRFKVSVDDVLIFDHVDTTPIWDEGYFGLYAMSGKPATIKDFEVIEETRTGNWVTAVEGATLEAVPSGVTLLGSGATAVYEKQQYKNGTFEFTLNADTEDQAWPAVTMRMANYDNDIWSGNQGYLVAFKSDIIEFQRFGGVGSEGYYYKIDNTGIFNSGQDHKVRVSTVDTTEGVRFTVAVDGVKIYDHVDTEPVRDAGYFGLYAMAGKPLTIKNFVPREEKRLDGWVTSTDGATLTSVPNGVTLQGSEAIGAYSEQKFKNETFKFTFNAETENAWPGFAMRLSSYDRPIWEVDGYLVAFKPDIIEFQRFGGTENKQWIEDIDNTGIFNSGQDHEIQASVVDKADGVLLTVYVDGVKIYEHLDTAPVLNEGYFGLYAMAGKPVTITNFRSGNANDAFTKGPLEDLLFTDVTAAHPAYDSIHFLAYTQAVANEAVAFQPDQNITIGDFIDMAMKAMCHTLDQPCVDLTEGSAMNMALEAGLVLEGEVTDPEQEATVEKMLQILGSALEFSGIDVSEAAQYEVAVAGKQTGEPLTRAEAAQLLMRFIHVY